MTIRPGSLAIAVTLGAGAGDVARMATLLGAIAGTVIVAVTIYLCYRFAARAARLLGDAVRSCSSVCPHSSCLLSG